VALSREHVLSAPPTTPPVLCCSLHGVTGVQISTGPKGWCQGRACQDVTSRNAAQSPRTSLCSANKAHLFPTAAGSPTSGKEQDTGVGKALSSKITRDQSTEFCPSDVDSSAMPDVLRSLKPPKMLFGHCPCRLTTSLLRDAWGEGFHLKVRKDGTFVTAWGRWHIKQ